jgi:serine/threonine-protein kinase HipA
MTVNGKRDNFTRADLLEPARQFGIKNAKAVIEQVSEAVSRWTMVAKEVGAAESTITRIAETHRLHLR